MYVRRRTRSRNFNPRSPCGERHTPSVMRSWHFLFQSTLPVWGATQYVGQLPQYYQFQSTLPVWGATMSLIFLVILLFDFNPRSPCGERHSMKEWCISDFLFQSTLPVWGATWTQFRASYHKCISIHAPRVGSDVDEKP